MSSQFISGLLFALPLLAGTSTLHLIPPVESRSYIDMTRAVQAAFGVHSRWLDEKHSGCIPAGSTIFPCDYTVEGDYSQAAFPAVLGAVAGGVTLTGLAEKTLQGDAAILDILRRCGAVSPARATGVTFAKAPFMVWILTFPDCPDLGPILMVLGLLCEGTTGHPERGAPPHQGERPHRGYGSRAAHLPAAACWKATAAPSRCTAVRTGCMPRRALCMATTTTVSS